MKWSHHSYLMLISLWKAENNNGGEEIMTIVGIKPVDHAYWVANNTEYYDRQKLRQILIEFANSKNAMRRDMTVEQIVDEFLENN